MSQHDGEMKSGGNGRDGDDMTARVSNSSNKMSTPLLLLLQQ